VRAAAMARAILKDRICTGKMDFIIFWLRMVVLRGS
jgi:hypothetical protein